MRPSKHLAHLARGLAELAGAAAHVPALAECSAQLSALLLAQQQAAEAAAAAADEGGEPAATAPFRRLPADLVNLVLLHCDARSLGRISCASPFFGGGGQRSLVQRVAFGEARLALHTPALRPHDLSRLVQLSRFEDPLPMDVALLRQLAVLHWGKPGSRVSATRLRDSSAARWRPSQTTRTRCSNWRSCSAGAWTRARRRWCCTGGAWCWSRVTY